MATIPTSPIGFRVIQAPEGQVYFNFWSYPKHEIQNVHQPHISSEIDYPAKFIACSYAEIKAKGALFLESCTVDKVEAKGSILLINSQVKEVHCIDGEVVLLNSSVADRIQAKLIHTTHKLSGIITGKVVQCNPGITTRSRCLYIDKAQYVKKQMELAPDVRGVILDGIDCEVDVIFPADSMVPEEERAVILRNGAQFSGKVIRGHVQEES